MSIRMSGIGMTSTRTRTRMIERLRQEGIKDEVVLAVMGSIPRHIFVEEALASRAYEDTPLPIGYGQTISSPFIVARMAEILRGKGELNRVLEVGAGCGYQAAVLGRLAREVLAVERIGPLVVKAKQTLRELKINNVRVRHTDGLLGFPDLAPFDGIIVSAAASHVPEILKEQLAIRGRMVLPLGVGEQYLVLIERDEKGYKETTLEGVRFVPLLPGTLQ